MLYEQISYSMGHWWLILYLGLCFFSSFNWSIFNFIYFLLILLMDRNIGGRDVSYRLDTLAVWAKTAHFFLFVGLHMCIRAYQLDMMCVGWFIRCFSKYILIWMTLLRKIQPIFIIFNVIDCGESCVFLLHKTNEKHFNSKNQSWHATCSMRASLKKKKIWIWGKICRFFFF